GLARSDVDFRHRRSDRHDLPGRGPRRRHPRRVARLPGSCHTTILERPRRRADGDPRILRSLAVLLLLFAGIRVGRASPDELHVAPLASPIPAARAETLYAVLSGVVMDARNFKPVDDATIDLCRHAPDDPPVGWESPSHTCGVVSSAHLSNEAG